VLRKLSVTNKAFSAECLGIAFSHLRTSEILIKGQDYAGAVARLYYSAFFGAKAALADLGRRSNKHEYWLTHFNLRFGRRTSWVPKKYVKLLNNLQQAREKHDYYGGFPNDSNLAVSYHRQVFLLLKKVKNNTPLVLYPEFIEEFLNRNDDILAIEFDYYCPKSYIHKERIQFQIQANRYKVTYSRRIKNAGKLAAALLGVTREENYVVGWDNRLGQGGDGYLLFLDIDEDDDAKVKTALKSRKGWLFKSGGGYHFIDEKILPTQKMWLMRFLAAARSKKLKSLVDDRYVKFSVRRGYSTLRIHKSNIKPFTPFLCWDNTRGN